MPAHVPPRKILLHGRPTSIRLEPWFWQWLREIAREVGCTVEALINNIAIHRDPHWPLTSALRLYIAQYWRNANGPRYYVDLDRGTRRPRTQSRFSDSGRPPRQRAA
jgi:predicted DNA-binding ribbon-helix-helix protein